MPKTLHFNQSKKKELFMSTVSELSLAEESNIQDLVYDYSCRALLGIVWISSFIFGLYILANYASAYFDNDLQDRSEAQMNYH